MELTEAAAAIAPHVDRLVVAVHRRMAHYRDEVSRFLRTSGVPRPVLIVDLRPFLVEGPVPLSVFEAFGRFMPPSTVADVLASLTVSGALARRGDALVPSPGAIQFAEGLTVLQSRVIEGLWGSHADVICDLLSPTAAAVAAASAGEAGLPLFGPLAQLDEPDRGDPYRVHHRITMLRYLRTDIHVAELAAQGLSPRDAVVVDELWRHGPSAPSPVDRSLEDDGWVDASGALTDLGRRRREAVEAATDRRVDMALGGASPDHVAALCDLLPRLPS